MTYGYPVKAYGSIADMPPLSDLPAPSALITDYQLERGENGLDVRRRFNAVHPDVPIILVTAYASDHLTQSAASCPTVAAAEADADERPATAAPARAGTRYRLGELAWRAPLPRRPPWPVRCPLYAGIGGRRSVGACCSERRCPNPTGADKAAPSRRGTPAATNRRTSRLETLAAPGAMALRRFCRRFAASVVQQSGADRLGRADGAPRRC